MTLAQITTDADPALIASEILKAVGQGQYTLALVLAVLVGTVIVRRYGSRIPWIGPRIGPWLATTTGAATVALVGSVVGALATALLAGEAFTLGLVLKAAMVAVVALLPSAAANAQKAGDAAAAKVDSTDAAIAEINK